MNAVPFDTLGMARKLQASGVEGAVATGMVEALVDALIGAELATKADVGRTAAAIDGLRAELQTDLATRHIELKTELANLNTQLKMDNELLRRDVIIKFGGMMVIGVGVLLTAMRYLLLHP